jgi:hypothetical protein
VFTARAGGASAPVHIADGVQTVFLVAAPLALLGLLVLLWLPEAELKARS